MSQNNVSIPVEYTDDGNWRMIYLIGGIAAIVSLMVIVSDIVIGSVMVGDLSAIPPTAEGRFAQFHLHPWLGLYNLDLLNTVNQLISLPVYFALYAAHRHVQRPYALLAMMISLLATSIFVTTNTALPMLTLSNKYATATALQKPLLAAAGEAMLARGEHGGFGVFFGFALSTLAALGMSLVMLKGQVFSKLNAYLGIIGNVLMLMYVVLVTFNPAVKTMAIIFATPGGLLLMAWMIMLTLRLFQLGRRSNRSP